MRNAKQGNDLKYVIKSPTFKWEFSGGGTVSNFQPQLINNDEDDVGVLILQ